MSFGGKSDSFGGADVRGDGHLPELYPPRILPKVMKKKPQYLQTYRLLDDKAPFSGFYIEDESTIGHNHSIRYIHVVGKRYIRDELDLHVSAQYANQTTTKDQGGSSSTSTISTSHLNGSAMTSFPAELRRFFPKLSQSSEPLPTPDQPIIRSTTLGPFVPKTREQPKPGPSVVTKKRTLIQTGAQQAIDYSLRIPRKQKVLVDTHAKEKTSNKKIRMGKIRSNRGGDDDDDDDDAGKKRHTNRDGDDEEDDDDGNDSDNEFAYSDDDHDSDGDYGVTYEDDDEDGNDMLAGGNDDEPVF